MGRNSTFEVKIIDESAKAFKCRCDGKEFWVPKSQIEDPDVDTLAVGDEEAIEIPNWLADKLDLL